MFSKILIANRGEIACRIIDSCRRLGVATVAVHSDADAGARHVAMADEAWHLPGNAPADTYLQGAKLIDIARATGAEAIHPGYGFLSENPEFVEQVTAAGLVFIGPSAQAIRAMGLKDAAKALMEKAGVPVVPGYHGADQSDAVLAQEAGRIGYPVLIKAVAGGGGKGMRRVEDASGFATALASARAEAQGAFGNPAVLVEKYIERPRHIEIQVFGDGARAVHLYERDCSLQRRHQKVIEEAPAPGMTAELRQAMGAAAVRAAEAIGYSGAGTVEFIVDAGQGLRPDGFWFMEMNTRLQVEHPVTEAVTGLDLVEWQLRVAAGETLPLVQDQISLTGHAVEARLYAEDVPAGFLPATGRLAHLAFGAGVRVETGVRAGDAISPFYDPMIAKLVAHGATREIALARLSRALAATEVAGLVTNLDFLGALCSHPGVRRGEVDTHLIARDLEELVAQPETPPQVWAMAALVALGLDAEPGWAQGFALWSALHWRAELRQGETRNEARLSCLAPGVISVELPEARITLRHGVRGWTADGAPAGHGLRQGGTITIFALGRAWVFEAPDPLAVDTAGPGQGLTLSPMPGLVRAVDVAEGQAVARGDRLAVLEAMKMEHALTASRDGVVAEVLVAPGDQVEAGQPLIRLEEGEG
ncbi:acetyl/propionyl/methylcrotonyl-CoA carboxylase subunit alpha [Frigidibacter sp. ROC022]|uniref:acetyl/propionyl/methylcrotonyl-CoA carboxylase subunit alpha n=1 Tax=Frigidibacter sp. ROC022 TaxID=2971796 RepID=UPI00215A9D51|nr:acetyl/propionyl/methylcrotonyl-CoA carboxylase subunit alpha [Frigidibacter sp. ROC022]MCR8723548.1 acetyl/propionyl/methylcrotonyl-CoA carboxylase subunit alpha [Frigidibacter sp. ROC022]